MAAFPSASTPATVTYVGNNLSASATTVYTFTNEGTGSDTDRSLIVVVLNYRGGDPSDVTANDGQGGGDLAMTNAVKAADGTDRSQIWYITGQTTSTSTIEITTGGANNMSIGVYAVYNSGTGAPDYTATDFGSDPCSASLTIPTDGIGIGGGVDDVNTTHTWTNLTGDYETNPSSSTKTAGASTQTEEGATTIEWDPSAASSQNAMALASWGPA